MPSTITDIVQLLCGGMSFLPCPAQDCTAVAFVACSAACICSMFLLMSGPKLHGSCASFAIIYAWKCNTSNRCTAAVTAACHTDRELSQVPVLVQSAGACLPTLADI